MSSKNYPHVGIFGKTNQGKSSLINTLVDQNVAIVSEVAGTTTDPVRKTIEFLGVGPIVFIDTAGIADKSELGNKRSQKTILLVDQVDLGIIILSNNSLSEEESELLEKLSLSKTPLIIVHGKNDLQPLKDEFIFFLQKKYKLNFILPYSLKNETQLRCLKKVIEEQISKISHKNKGLFSGLVKPNDLVLLVTPIDSEAPVGRLILPQVQAIRSLLDEHATCIVIQDSEVDFFLKNKNLLPNLIVTDSQVFKKVNKIVPSFIPLTSFSILLAYNKGNFNEYLKGTLHLSNLKDGDKILILESCTHQITCEDIGRIKIPRWINEFTKKKLNYEVVSGLDTPKLNIEEYSLILQCGGCMITQNQLKKRLLKAIKAGVPITNYGMAIAYINGIYNRVIAPFI